MASGPGQERGGGDGAARRFSRLLVANRGEIAIRIFRTAADLGIGTVAIHSEDDSDSNHIAFADRSVPLSGRGAPAYLDIDQIVSIAVAEGCDAIHPGYGFLSENAGFARACADAGIVFVGPRPELIELFGDKLRARALAKQCGVNILAGTSGTTSLEEARAFLDSLGAGGAMMIKAVAGGGGRGMRAVTAPDQLDDAFARCQSEARRSFGNDQVYVERFIPRARHVEIQIVGDGEQVIHLGERECSLQRQNQKLVEIAPSPSLDDDLRGRLVAAARGMAGSAGYDNLGTFEFLIDLDRLGREDDHVFIETNPRIQVEHTVTEEVMGLDLVRLQLEIAAGRTLEELGLRASDVRAPAGYAIQLRINMEGMDKQGRPRPSKGVLSRFTPPSGPGVRVDSFGYVGYQTVTSFDSLLAKLIVSTRGSDFAAAVRRARRALGEFAIEGLETNLAFMRALLDHPLVEANEVHTRFIEEHIGDLLAAMPAETVKPTDDIGAVPPGCVAVPAPLLGVVSSIDVVVGDRVGIGQQLAVVEAMKMEHPVLASCGGIVRVLPFVAGDQVAEGALVAAIEAQAGEADADSGVAEFDLDHIRPDLALTRERAGMTLDDQRPEAVAKRRDRGQRTARENIGDLCDAGSFLEYGGLATAFQRSRKTPEQLRVISPADGLVMGIATVNAGDFGKERASIALAAYDGSVFAGTQGWINHRKLDRMLEVAGHQRIPFVLFAEGGGGRPSDDAITIAGLDTPTFTQIAKLNGEVPIVGIVSGRCFAGNAALLGCCDVIIATENSTIGMGGPAMIDGAGLGVFTPEEVGPIDVHVANGVVDIRVADEAAAVDAARRYLSYFQGTVKSFEAEDQRLLRFAIPENRMRVYDIREVIELLADKGSVLELRAGFGRAAITALVRIGGRPIGLFANNPAVNAGAVDADSADKVARFIRLCDAHGLPLISLIDTPGIMVGPESEKTAVIRHASRLFMATSRAKVPVFAVVLRKAYGLGAQASAAGHFHVPAFTIAWPTGEVGGMGLEGAVRLAYRRDMEAIADPEERKAFFDAKVAELYERGKALSAAANFELDAVIDPAETRDWLIAGLDAAAPIERSGGTIDTW